MNLKGVAKMAGQLWKYEEELAVLHLKAKYEGQLRVNHPEVKRLAKATDRSVDAIVMRRRNFDSLDESVPGVALSNVRKQTRCIWKEYVDNPRTTLTKAKNAYSDLVND